MAAAGRRLFSDWLILRLELHSGVQLHENHVVGGPELVVQYKQSEGQYVLLLHPPLT